MTREERIEIFEGTKEYVESLDLTPKVIGFIPYSDKTVKIVAEDLKHITEYNKSNIIFDECDTITAAIKYHKLYGGIDFLTFASSKHYGGGVWTGAKAQEEDIFRCTDLYKLKEDVENRYYPLNGILAVKCHIVRDKNFNNLDDEITATTFFAAAPNLNKKMHDPKLDIDFKSRMYCLTEATLKHSTKNTLVIGAWGCGVFANDPKYVASLFKKVMPLLFDDYEHIVVAIPDKQVLEIFKNTILQ